VNACVYLKLSGGDNVAREIVKRSILIKEIIEVFGEHQREPTARLHQSGLKCAKVAEGQQIETPKVEDKKSEEDPTVTYDTLLDKTDASKFNSYLAENPE